MTKPVLKSAVEEAMTETAAEMHKRQKSAAKSSHRNGHHGNGSATLLPPDPVNRYDDIATAERFLEFAGEDLLYLSEARKWMIWDGARWKVDTEDFVFELAVEFAKNLRSPEFMTSADAIRYANHVNNQKGLNAFLSIAARLKTVTAKALDTQPFLINCRNGTLDLRTYELRPHDRSDLITKAVNCDYDPDAVSPAFDRFLAAIQPDPAVRAFLQRSIGYSLLGTVRERSFWILYGTGNNGKSVFVNLFNNLLGEYASGTTTASIMASKQSAIPNDIARLQGKRFIIIPETEENERLNSALVKALSAGDQITARFLFGEYFDFFFTGKLWIATNHKPTITDHSKGFWDRLKLIPFSQNIPAEQLIKSDELMSQLMAEAAGIFAWAVQGCRDYFEVDGLDVPEVIQREIDAYRWEQDSIAQFVEARIETYEQARARAPDRYFNAADFRVANPDLYRAYKRFCEENGEYLRSQRKFTINLKERGFRQQNAAGRYWDGVRLIDPGE